MKKGYEHIVHELLVNIKRSCIRGRNCAQTVNNMIATCDHIENMADEAIGYLKDVDAQRPWDTGCG